MTFNSFSYLLFLPFVYLLFYFTADRWRWLVLLSASYGFYASFGAPYLLTVLLAVTGISHACGLKMAALQGDATRKYWLWVGVLSCLGVLALTKYPSFFQAVLGCLQGRGCDRSSSAIVSLGVSFFTFQAISYLADVYLDLEEPERHFGRYALYLAFFPKLLQGPIERAGDLLPQLKRSYQFDYDEVRSGLLLFAWGLFKKVVVANRLALYADHVYDNVHGYSGLTLLIGTYAYALQIYFDFAGYTDMARGTARIFGIKLTENFHSPYLATSIADFWRRWHISFSRWILDYVFKPLQLGWRNWGQSGTALALIVAFLVSGLWHGATWGFVVWGLLHGSYLASSVYYRPYQKRLHKRLGIEKSTWLSWWQMFITFHLVCLAWVFFRSKSLADARYVISNFWGSTNGARALLYAEGSLELLWLAIACSVVALVALLSRYTNVKSAFNAQPVFCRWLIYCGLSVGILLFYCDNLGRYIYFKF